MQEALDRAALGRFLATNAAMRNKYSAMLSQGDPPMGDFLGQMQERVSEQGGEIMTFGEFEQGRIAFRAFVTNNRIGVTTAPHLILGADSCIYDDTSLDVFFSGPASNEPSALFFNQPPHAVPARDRAALIRLWELRNEASLPSVAAARNADYEKQWPAMLPDVARENKTRQETGERQPGDFVGDEVTLFDYNDANNTNALWPEGQSQRQPTDDPVLEEGLMQKASRFLERTSELISYSMESNLPESARPQPKRKKDKAEPKPQASTPPEPRPDDTVWTYVSRAWRVAARP